MPPFLPLSIRCTPRQPPHKVPLLIASTFPKVSSGIYQLFKMPLIHYLNTILLCLLDKMYMLSPKEFHLQ